MTLKSACGSRRLSGVVLVAALAVAWGTRFSSAEDPAPPGEVPATPAQLKAIEAAATPAEQNRLATALAERLETSKLSDADLGLLLGLADTLERLHLDDAARGLYTKFAPRLSASDDPGRKQLAALMTGALRRLDCVGKPFALEGETCDGHRLDIASLKGKVVLVVFWATSAPDALQELLAVRRLERDFRGCGLEVVGVSADGDRPTLERFMREIVMPWPTLNDRQAGLLQPALVQYGISVFPTTFLVGRDGKVLSMNLRGRALRRQLISLLGLPPIRRLVSAGPESTSTINDVGDRILDICEPWLQEGKLKTGQQLLADGLPATTAGAWAAPRRQPVSDEDLYRQALDSVFVLGTIYRTRDNPDWQVFSGTAFAVTADGILSTSAHMFDFSDGEVGGMVVFDAAGRPYPVERLLAIDAGADTCLFRIPVRNLRPLPLAGRTPVGTRVRVVSHPGSTVYYLSDGLVSGYEIDETGNGWMHVSAPFGEGSSGAPVFDPLGNVVGQVSQTSTLFSMPQGAPQKPHASRRFVGAPPRPCAHPKAESAGSTGEPQMVFRICTPAARMEKLFAK